VKFSAKPARLKKTGEPSLQNFPMAHRPDFSGPVRFCFLEHDPEKSPPVLRKITPKQRAKAITSHVSAAHKKSHSWIGTSSR
jgi:hypothetical protein